MRDHATNAKHSPRQQRATQAAVSRAVKGVANAGVAVGRVEVKPDGTIIVYPAAPLGSDLVSKGGFRL